MDKLPTFKEMLILEIEDNIKDLEEDELKALAVLTSLAKQRAKAKTYVVKNDKMELKDRVFEEMPPSSIEWDIWKLDAEVHRYTEITPNLSLAKKLLFTYKDPAKLAIIARNAGIPLTSRTHRVLDVMIELHNDKQRKESLS